MPISIRFGKRLAALTGWCRLRSHATPDKSFFHQIVEDVSLSLTGIPRNPRGRTSDSHLGGTGTKPRKEAAYLSTGQRLEFSQKQKMSPLGLKRRFAFSWRFEVFDGAGEVAGVIELGILSVVRFTVAATRTRSDPTTTADDGGEADEDCEELEPNLEGMAGESEVLHESNAGFLERSRPHNNMIVECRILRQPILTS